jgi:hypothetical protein
MRRSNGDDAAPQKLRRNIPLLVVSSQTVDAIKRRRDIREAFHDDRATTVKKTRRNR